MIGRYTLNSQTILELVTLTLPGVYVLSDAGVVGDYVGRSDGDVKERLRSWSNGVNSYRYFWFEYAASAKSAFELECYWWHKLLPRDNVLHPDRPANTSWQCPYCDIFRPKVGIER